MNFRNQARELIDADAVMRDIAADNLRNQTGVNLFRGVLLFHSFHSQRLIWGQYSRERSGYNFQHENIWNDRFPEDPLCVSHQWRLCGLADRDASTA